MVECKRCGTEYDESLDTCPNCYEKNPNKSVIVNRGKVRSVLRGWIIRGAVLLVIAALIAVFVITYNSKGVSLARDLIDEGDYIGAWEVIDTVDEGHADRIKLEIREAAADEIAGLISNGDIVGAVDAIETYQFLEDEERASITSALYEACPHKLELEDQAAATCDSAGFKKHKCSVCGFEKTDTLKKLTHKYEYKTDKKATCAADGSKTGTCKLCSKTVVEAIKATGHKWNEKIEKKATCAAEGTKKLTCTVCKESKSEKIAKTNTHTFNETVVLAATCKSSGEKKLVCSICSKTKTETIPKTDVHTYTETIVSPVTCVDDGLTTFTCTVCNDESTKTIPATGVHKFVEEIITQASCSYDGDKHEVCTMCSEERNYSVISALGHNYSAATCTDNQKCKRCGDTIYGSSLGHEWVDATCTVPETCSRCKETYGSAAGHWWTDATCTELSTCRRCNITTGELEEHYYYYGECYYCDAKDPNYVIEVSYVYISSYGVSVYVGDTYAIEYTVSPSNATNKTLTWTSSDPSVATVNANGVVTGVSAGEAQITATAHNGEYDYIYVTVKEDVVAKSSLTVQGVPCEVHHYDWSGDKCCSASITGVTYNFEEDYWMDNYVELSVTFTGKKTYDIDGNGNNNYYKFMWKLYDAAGILVDSGTCYSSYDVAVGDGFSITEDDIGGNLVPGAYKLVVLDAVD